MKASQMALVVKNLLANSGHVRDTSSIPELGRSPGGGHGTPLQYSCLENPMYRGAWQTTVHSVPKSPTWVKQLSTQRHTRTLGMQGLREKFGCWVAGPALWFRWRGHQEGARTPEGGAVWWERKPVRRIVTSRDSMRERDRERDRGRHRVRGWGCVDSNSF